MTKQEFEALMAVMGMVPIYDKDDKDWCYTLYDEAAADSGQYLWFERGVEHWLGAEPGVYVISPDYSHWVPLSDSE